MFGHAPRRSNNSK
jgi:hypothetical protein